MYVIFWIFLSKFHAFQTFCILNHYQNIRQNISKNNGKFVTPTKKLKAEPGLSSIFKNYDKADLIKDLKKGKDLGEISIEYFAKNEKDILKIVTGVSYKHSYDRSK